MNKKISCLITYGEIDAEKFEERFGEADESYTEIETAQLQSAWGSVVGWIVAKFGTIYSVEDRGDGHSDLCVQFKPWANWLMFGTWGKR